MTETPFETPTETDIEINEEAHTGDDETVIDVASSDDIIGDSADDFDESQIEPELEEA